MHDINLAENSPSVGMCFAKITPHLPISVREIRAVTLDGNGEPRGVIYTSLIPGTATSILERHKIPPDFLCVPNVHFARVDSFVAWMRGTTPYKSFSDLPDTLRSGITHNITGGAHGTEDSARTAQS